MATKLDKLRQLLRRLGRSGVAMPLAALAAAALMLISETAHWHSVEALDKLAELNAARARLQRVMLSVTDAETAQRGYLLTGRADYLEPYRNAIEGLPVTLGWLRHHYANRPKPAAWMAALDDAVARRLSELDALSSYTEEGRADRARELMLTGIGRDGMEAIRRSAEQMLAHERNVSLDVQAQIQQTLLLNRLGVAAVTALGLLALYLYLRQTRAVDAQRKLQRRAMQEERDQLEADVGRRTQDLTELSRHLMTVREDERARLARELHDELGAMLTAAKLDVMRIKTRVAGLSPDVSERIAHLNHMLDDGIALKRHIIEELRPSTLDNLGLHSALELLANEFERSSELAVDCSLQPVKLDPATALTAYRVVQEALINVGKYAQAGHVRITLGAHAGVAEVQVSDDGVGFDPQVQKRSAHGLLGMRYRVEAGHGTLSLLSAPGQGTIVRATLPLPRPTPAPATTTTAI